MKKGGPNPISNTVLASIIEKAKELDVPKEILERNIKRASEKGQESYIEKLYEVNGNLIFRFYYYFSFSTHDFKSAKLALGSSILVINHDERYPL